MKITISGLNSGSYYLAQNKISFHSENINIEQSKYNDLIIELDTDSALEVTHTLLDKLNMLDNKTEKLLEQIEEVIANER